MKGIYVAAIAMFACLVIVGMVGIYAILAEQSEENFERTHEVVATQTSKGCARNQIQRGYLLNRATELQNTKSAEHAPHLFRIVWCERTYARGYKGSVIYLSPPAQRCFLELMRRGHWDDKEPITDPTAILPFC